jgi:hypothetical protein
MEYVRNRAWPVEEFEPIFGKLDKEQLALINDYLVAFNEGRLKQYEWEEQHPEAYSWIKKNVEAYSQSQKDGELSERAHSTTE